MRSCCFRSTQRGRWATWTTNWGRWGKHGRRMRQITWHLRNLCFEFWMLRFSVAHTQMHFFRQVSIHSVWLGNNITPLREEEWGEDEEDEADTPAPTSPPTSPINSRSAKKKMQLCALTHFFSLNTGHVVHSCFNTNTVFVSFSGSIVQVLTFTPVPSFSWSFTASGSSLAPRVTGGPQPSSSVKWSDRWAALHILAFKGLQNKSEVLENRNLVFLNLSTVVLLFSVAAGSVGSVHREEPVWHDVLHPDGTAEASSARGWDPQSVPGACHLQGCCCPGHGEHGCEGGTM